MPRRTQDRGDDAPGFLSLDAPDPLAGFLPPTDAHVRATVLAIAGEFTEDELVLRYRAGETGDGFAVLRQPAAAVPGKIGAARPGAGTGAQPGSAGRASAHLLFLLFRGRAAGVSLIRGRAAGPGFPAHAGKNRHCAGGSREHGDGGHLEPARAP